MKKFNKFAKKMLAMIVATAIILASTTKVYAASESIQLGDATYTGNYIAGVYFSDKKTTDGKYLYCLNMPKTTAANVKANIVRNSKYIDGGIVYILQNGYPNKSITGDKSYDYYITQTAVWWYLDEVKGTSNLGDQFKNTGSDSYNLRRYVKQLVNDGIKHKNDSISIADTKLSISTNDITMKLNNGYYESNSIKATVAQNISSYKVSLTGAPAGTIIEKSGARTNYTGEFTVNANESFVVKVPEAKVTADSLSIKVNASAVGNAQYTAYEYQPVNTNMQNVALLEKTAKSASAALTLQLIKETKKPVVSILKVDQETNKPLAGAVLAIKDSNGTIVYKFPTKEEAEIVTDLEYGTYTIEELSAPTGYIKSDKVFTITIDKDHLTHQITFVNAKEVYVPDTANASSVIMIILGIVLTGAGIRFVYKNAKKA